LYIGKFNIFNYYLSGVRKSSGTSRRPVTRGSARVRLLGSSSLMSKSGLKWEERSARQGRGVTEGREWTKGKEAPKVVVG
jgi:hypothetical protein